MAYIDILNNCEYVLSSIYKCYACTLTSTNTQINFPVDVNYINDYTIDGEINDNLNYFNLKNDINYKYFDVDTNVLTINEEKEKARQGDFFIKTLTFEINKINDNKTKTIKDLLLTNNNFFNQNPLFIVFVDNNLNKWIAGWDVPFVLDSFEMQTDKVEGENKYVFKYISKSYERIKKITY